MASTLRGVTTCDPRRSVRPKTNRWANNTRNITARSFKDDMIALMAREQKKRKKKKTDIPTKPRIIKIKRSTEWW